jgi:hypothetical protein
MQRNRWLKLRSIEDPFKINLKEGEVFLHGNAMIGQKEIKKIGDQITYYKIIKSEGKSIEYIQVFDILEEDKNNDERN